MIEGTLILINGKIWTGETKKKFVDSVVILQDRIIFAGARDYALNFKGKKSIVIDLEQRTAVPGFIDCHTHFVQGSLFLKYLNLRDVKSENGFIRELKKYVKNITPGEWVYGGNWDNSQWNKKAFPSKKLIDEFTSENPVLLYRVDIHTVLVNSAALKRAGIDKNTPDPDGGLIERNPATGEPTGILKESAVELINEHLPREYFQKTEAAVKDAMRKAHKNGVTSIHDISTFNDVKLYQDLLSKGDLELRIFARTPLQYWKELERIGIRAGFGNEFLRLGSLKAFIDGALGSNTAYLFEPYLDESQNYGLLNSVMIPETKIRKLVRDADKSGLNLSIHAIGDKANNMLLNIYSEVTAEGIQWDRRLRIEHAQHLLEEDIKRFKELNVIVSAQPYHLAGDGVWAEEKIGHDRCAFSYPFRSLLDNRAKLVFGSDWPVTPIEPLLGIHAAVTRETNDDKNPDGWFPEQKISVEESLFAYTRDAAYASFEEKIKGTLTQGKLADIVILSDNLFEIDPVNIKDVVVEITILGGEIIYQNK